MVHNVTEGLGVAAPIADELAARPSVARLAALVLIAGGPAILGAWIGGLVIAAGWGYTAPSLVGAGLAVLGLGVCRTEQLD